MFKEESFPLEEQERQRLLAALRESEILRELGELLVSSLDLNHILKTLTKRTTEVCETERCSVWLLEEPDTAFRPATYHFPTRHLNHRLVETADHIWYSRSVLFDDPEILQQLREQGMTCIEDLSTYPGAKNVAETFFVRSVLFVALKHEGRIVGMMSLDDPGKTRTFSAQQQQLVRAIGQQAALAIHNARLYRQAQAERERAERLIGRARAIYQVALAVNSGEELSEVLQIATHHLIDGLNANGGAIALLEDGILRLICHMNSPEPDSEITKTLVLRSLPYCGQVAQTGDPLFMKAKDTYGTELHWFHQLGLEHFLIVPLMVGVGETGKGENNTIFASPQATRCIGFAFANFHDPNYYPAGGQFAFAKDIAAQCALAIEKARLLTDVNKAAKLAIERANTMEAVFQAMTEGITVVSPDGNVLVRNNAASIFLGVPINTKSHLQAFLRQYQTYSLRGQPLTEEDFPLTRALRGEHIRGERFVTKRSDGSERVLEINVTQLLDETQQQIGLVSAFRDITEQMRVEVRIRQALETMLHVAEAVSGITEIKDILYSVLERTLVTLNCERGVVQLYDEEKQVFTRLLSIGFSKEAETRWLLKQSAWLTPVVQQYQDIHDTIMDGHATIISAEHFPQHSNPFHNTMALAAPITHSNRLLGLMIVDRSPLPEEESQPLLLESDTWDNANDDKRPPIVEFSVWDMAVMEGIAQLTGLAIEQTRWQEEAAKARTSEAAMREANTLKDDFLSITAHEFRSPLSVMLMQCQLALRALRRMTTQDQPSKLLDQLVGIESQIHLLTNIVQTYLEVTQINDGQLTIKLDPVNLVEITKKIVANQSAATAKEHSITFSITPSDYSNSYFVMGDEARLSQILTNLTQNAIKYSPQGGPITISLCQFTSGDDQAQPTIEVCVADKGIGIPKEALPHLFERFYRAPNTKHSSAKGIGLGLYVVAQLIYMHGGTIRAESSGVEGEGSRFIFTLPGIA